MIAGTNNNSYPGSRATQHSNRDESMTHQRVNLHKGKFLNAFEKRAGRRNEMALETIRSGVMAGAAGGLAEIAWVALYARMTGGDPAILARGVTTAAGASALLPASPAGLGIAVHMALAVTLGIVLAFGWRVFFGERAASTNPYPFVLAALSGVWAINFFVVLPIVSPAFIHMVPYGVSLTSKLVFGLVAAETLRWQVGSAQSTRPAAIGRGASL